MAEVIIGVIMFVLILGVIGLMVAWTRFLDWRAARQSVKPSPPAHPVVMSRAPDSAPPSIRPSLQTDGAQTSDRPMIPVPTREEMLDIFRILRAAGVNRETLRGPWRAAGLPLDNNLWSQAAAAAEDETRLTPIAGRPTRATFQEADPDLAYKPPPS